MATKRIIAEQVLRIVNSGSQTDDTKITLEEIMHLVNFERDALIKKAVMEASLTGEHEIPSEFLQRENITPGYDGDVMRKVLTFEHSPIFLPNDAAIFQVCPSKQHAIKGGGQGLDVRYVTIEQMRHANNSTESSVSISFSNKTETDVISNKFKFTFKHGYDSSSSLRSYSFPFTYKGGDKKLTARTINPQILLSSLEGDADFQDFLKTNRLKFTYSENSTTDTSSIYYRNTDFNFTSSYGGQYWGGVKTKNFELISTTTNRSVVDWNSDGLKINSTFAEVDTKIEPSISFGVKVDYSNNKDIKDLESDVYGVKEKGSSVLNGVLELSSDEIKDFDVNGYGIISGTALANMWIYKFASIFREYGVFVGLSANQAEDGGVPSIKMIEEDALGGFDAVDFQNFSGTSGSVTGLEIDGYIPVKNQLSEFKDRYTKCYLRMPNPGMSSRLYNDTILLSGERYWYREDNKIFLYNDNDPTYARPSYDVWYIAETEAYDNGTNLPMPPEYVPEIVKNLIQTFTIMNQAKEDIINDNTDVV